MENSVLDKFRVKYAVSYGSVGFKKVILSREEYLEVTLNVGVT